MIVVSNAGPLIALAKISQLPLLQTLFGELVIPWRYSGRLCKRPWYFWLLKACYAKALKT